MEFTDALRMTLIGMVIIYLLFVITCLIGLYCFMKAVLHTIKKGPSDELDNESGVYLF